jgi:hypothetical protein
VTRDVTEAELQRAALRTEGCSYDSRDLKRFRQEGILQRARQIHESGVRGSISLYPRAAIDQIRAVCVVRRQHYRYDELRFHLWWDGHWVEQAKLQETLSRLAHEEVSVLDEWLEKYGSVDAVADEAAKVARDLKERNPVVRLIKVQIGDRRADLETLLFNVVLLAYGREPAWGSGEQDLGDSRVEEVFHRAAFSATGGGVRRTPAEGRFFTQPERADEMPDAFKVMREVGILPLSNLTEIIESATRQELERAKDDARTISEDMRVAAEAAEVLFGRGAFGLGFFRVFRQRKSALSVRLVLLPMMIALRRGPDEYSANIDAIKQALSRVTPKAKRILTVKEQLKTAFR